MARMITIPEKTTIECHVFSTDAGRVTKVKCVTGTPVAGLKPETPSRIVRLTPEEEAERAYDVSPGERWIPGEWFIPASNFAIGEFYRIYMSPSAMMEASAGFGDKPGTVKWKTTKPVTCEIDNPEHGRNSLACYGKDEKIEKKTPEKEYYELFD